MKILLIYTAMALIITVQFFMLLELRYDLICIKESFDLCQQHEIAAANFRSSTDNSNYKFLTNGSAVEGD